MVSTISRLAFFTHRQLKTTQGFQNLATVCCWMVSAVIGDLNWVCIIDYVEDMGFCCCWGLQGQVGRCLRYGISVDVE